MTLQHAVAGRFRAGLLAAGLLPLASPPVPADMAADPGPLAIRVVVLVNFEIGADSGDAPGEFQLWRERGLGTGPLDDCIELPFSTHRACLDPERGLLVTYTGLTQDRAAASVMAMGLDARFDFSRSYWLIGGIAGIDPEDGTLGSAVWARYVVNGDWGHEIDAREMPDDWTTGYLPFMRDEPYAQPMRDEQRKVYALNAQLAGWAFELTRDTELLDTPGAAALRSEYRGYPMAVSRATRVISASPTLYPSRVTPNTGATRRHWPRRGCCSGTTCRPAPSGTAPCTTAGPMTGWTTGPAVTGSS